MSLNTSNLSSEALKAMIHQKKQTMNAHQESIVAAKEAQAELARREGKALNEKAGKLMVLAEQLDEIFKEYKNKSKIPDDFDIVLSVSIINNHKEGEGKVTSRELIEHIDGLTEDNKHLACHYCLSDMLHNTMAGQQQTQNKLQELYVKFVQLLKHEYTREQARIRRQYESNFLYDPKTFSVPFWE